MMSPTEDDFELELRALPGVVNVGVRYSDKGDVDAVSLVVQGPDAATVRVVAKQIVSLYFPSATISIEEMKTIAPSNTATTLVMANRITLVRADFNSHVGSCEVHVTLNGRIGIGHSKNGPLIGGAEATLDALRHLDLEVPFYLVSSINIATSRGWPVIVTLRPTFNDVDRLGIAQADTELLSSAKATLSALNRFLDRATSEA